MSVHLLQEISGLSVGAARVRLGADSRDASLSEISDQLKSLNLAASLARLSSAYGANTYTYELFSDPLRVLGGYATGFEAAIDWLKATRELARRVERGASPRTKGPADPFVAAVLRSAIRWASADLLSRQDEAREKAFEILEKTRDESRRRWPRRLLVDVIKEVERAEALTHQTFTHFDAAARESVGVRSTRRASIWSSVEDKAMQAVAGAETVLERIPRLESLALEDALQSWQDRDSTVLWIRSESPVEIVFTVVGGVAGAAAVLNQLLDLEVKLRTRDLRIQAERKELEEKIEKNAELAQACQSIRASISRGQAPELGIREVTVHESLEQIGEEVS